MFHSFIVAGEAWASNFGDGAVFKLVNGVNVFCSAESLGLVTDEDVRAHHG
jgi:hypothetical protein